MGWAWNIILSFDNEELWDDEADVARETCEPLELINAWFDDGRLVSLTGPTYADDAGNGLDANLYGGGFKHFDIKKFIEVVEAQDWKRRGKVQLWVKGGEEGMSDALFKPIKLRREKIARPKPDILPKIKRQLRAKRKRTTKKM